jgi:hypothetical protein
VQQKIGGIAAVPEKRRSELLKDRRVVELAGILEIIDCLDSDEEIRPRGRRTMITGSLRRRAAAATLDRLTRRSHKSQAELRKEYGDEYAEAVVFRWDAEARAIAARERERRAS